MVHMDANEIERHVEHQRKVWVNLYGPAKAEGMAAQLADILQTRPDLDPRAAAAIVDPEDESEYEDFVATRW